MYSIMHDQKLLDIVSTKDRKKKPKSLDKIFKGAKNTHKMSDGSVMSGKKHTKKSKVVKAAAQSKRGRGKRSGY